MAMQHQAQTKPAWVLAHEDVLGVARERGGLERREGACLLEASRQRVHQHLGYGGFTEYTDRHLGYDRRTTDDKLRTAQALEHLPELARAQSEGSLPASAVRELARVAIAETERAWIEAAAGRRVRDVERLVSGRARGDLPTDLPRAELERHVLRFEVSAETLAAFRDAIGHIRELAGAPLEDDAALLMMARIVSSSALPRAGGSTLNHSEPANDTAAGVQQTSTEPEGSEHVEGNRAGRARYQISVFVCDICSGAFQPAGPDLVAISPAMLAAARCDARQDAGSTAQTHVGPSCMPAPRTTQTIPPSIRRRVLQRAKHTCQIPGCRHTLDLDVHHIMPRADGGGHDPANLIVLCPAHHRANHAGQLHITGTAPDSLTFRHADGTPYGATVQAASADVAEKVFNGLRWLGFKETDAKRALQRALAESTHDTDAQSLLKRALGHLGPR
jgi:hypothetical protein